MIFSYKFPLPIVLTAAASVLIPSLVLGFIVYRQWPLKALSGAFLLSAVGSLYSTAFLQITAEKLILFSLAVSVYLLLCCIPRGPADLIRWTVLYIGGLTVLACVGPFITQFEARSRVISVPWIRFSPARFPEILDPNLLAGLIAMTLPLLLLLGVCHSPILAGKRRWMLWGAFALLAMALVVTQSRAGWIAAASGLAVALLLAFPRVWILYVPVSAAAITASFTTDVPRLLDRTFSTGTLTTWESRREVWSRAIYLIQDFPATGIGAGTFPRVAPQIYPIFLNEPGVEIFHSHNLFLQAAVDFGLPGLVAFTALLSAALFLGKRARGAYLQKRDPVSAALAGGYICGLLVMIVHGLVDAPLWLTKPAPVPFFFMGMLVALHSAVAPLGKHDQRRARSKAQ